MTTLNNSTLKKDEYKNSTAPAKVLVEAKKEEDKFKKAKKFEIK